MEWVVLVLLVLLVMKRGDLEDSGNEVDVSQEEKKKRRCSCDEIEAAVSDGALQVKWLSSNADWSVLLKQWPYSGGVFAIDSLAAQIQRFSVEDPNRHLQQFHHVVTSLKQATADADTAMMTTFPFSLIDAVGEWLFCLPPGSITTWNGMKKLFLEKYFPASKVAVIRKEICGIRQVPGETLYEYWERYKKLLASCPHHQISDQLVIQYFYEELLSNERNLIDAASVGALTNKTIAEATSLLENMAANTQQLYTRGEPVVRKVNEVGDSSHLEHRMGKRLSYHHHTPKMLSKKVQCTKISKGQDMIHTLAHTIRVGKIIPISATPTSKRQFPILLLINKVGTNFLQKPRQETQGTSIDDKLNLILNTMTQAKQKSEMDMKDIRTQIGQLATTMSKLEAQAAVKLPSQPLNHKDNANAIDLRSGKQVEKPVTSPVSP
ncbi:uncharacterized protein LOC113360471 [Papaver somniferum]|uniref:uncharacterized protein LOC113360471 n=1 Tax=Papaver somniferum TaxID=3469 RepID=UPI000E705E80|nr:uncharacterized protein LOC113360471 [Papaver somniferum]